MALTKVTGHVVLPTTNIEFHNTKSTGIVTFTHTSNATSATTGALQVTGGVGIVKDLHVGGNITVGGTLTYDDVTNIDSLGILTARGGIHVGPPNAGVATVYTNGNASFTGIITATSFVGPLTGTASGNAVLTGSTDNQLVTVTGANAITGESNLTYDGNTLQVATDANMEGIKIVSSGDTYNDIQISANRSGTGNHIGRILGQWGSGNVASIIFNTGGDASGKDDGEIQFATSNGGSNPTTRMTIKQNGYIGINTTIPAAYLDIGAHNSGNPTLHVRNHTAAGTFTNKYGSEFRHSYNSANHAMLIHTAESTDTRRTLDISDSNGIFATFTNGKVGIGTTMPETNLHISGIGTNNIRIDTDATALSFHNHSEFIGFIGNDSGKLFINAGGTEDTLLLQTGGSERLLIRSDGKLQIGTSGGDSTYLTTSTNAVLDVWGDGSAYPTLRLGTEGYQIEGEDIRFGRKDIGATDIRYHSLLSKHDSSGTGNYLQFRIHDGGGSPFQAQKTVLHLNGLGNVGIGTDTPLNPLAVVGSSADIMVYDTDAYSQNVSGGAVAFAGKDSAGNRKTLADIRGVANGANIGEFAVRTRRSGGTLTEALRIDSDGKILMGVAANNGPDAPLHIYGSSDTTPILAFTRSSTHDDWQGGGIGLVDEGGTYKGALTFYTHASSGTKNDSVQERLRIDSSGRVGINTTILDTSADVSITNASSSARVYMKSADDADCSIYFGRMNDAATAAIRYDHDVETFRFYGYNNNQKLYIDGNSVIVAGSRLHATRTQAKFGIDCHTLNIFDDVNDPSNYGLVFYNDPTTNYANGIGFYNDDGQSCGGYIVHQDKGGSNVGDIVMATSKSANTPVERLRIESDGNIIQNLTSPSGTSPFQDSNWYDRDGGNYTLSTTDHDSFTAVRTSSGGVYNKLIYKRVKMSKNCDIEFDLSGNSPSGTYRHVGFTLNADGTAGNYDRLVFRSRPGNTNSNQIRIDKANNAGYGFNVTSSNIPTFFDGTERHILIQLRERLVNVLVDGEVIISEKTNADFYNSSGWFGFAIYEGGENAQVTIRNLEIRNKFQRPHWIVKGTGINVDVNEGDVFPFNSVIKSSSSMANSSDYNNGSYRFNVPIGGVYYVFARVYRNSSDTCEIAFYVNGSVRVRFRPLPQGGDFIFAGSALTELAKGDYIDVRAHTEDFNNFYGNSGEQWSSWGGHLID